MQKMREFLGRGWISRATGLVGTWQRGRVIHPGKSLVTERRNPKQRPEEREGKVFKAKETK